MKEIGEAMEQNMADWDDSGVGVGVDDDDHDDSYGPQLTEKMSSDARHRQELLRLVREKESVERAEQERAPKVRCCFLEFF